MPSYFRTHFPQWTPTVLNYEGQTIGWEKDYSTPDGVAGGIGRFIDEDERRLPKIQVVYVWVLYAKGGPNIDTGRELSAEQAMAAADEASRSDRTRRIVQHWRRTATSLPFGGQGHMMLRISPYLKSR